MKLLIEIPDRFVKDRDGIFIDDVYKATPEVMNTFFESILKGTPLPKHHGDLIDRNELLKQYGLENATKYGNKDAEQQRHSYSTMMMYEIADMIEDAETIILATEEGDAE